MNDTCEGMNFNHLT